KSADASSATAPTSAPLIAGTGFAPSSGDDSTHATTASSTLTGHTSATLYYRLVVTNPGSVALSADAVQPTTTTALTSGVKDTGCVSLTLIAQRHGTGADLSTGTLDNGDQWYYECVANAPGQFAS